MRRTSSKLGNTEIIENPVEFQASVSFLQLPETPVGLSRGTTPTALNQTKLKLVNSAPTTITNFLEGQEGQTIFVVGDGVSTLTHGTNIFTNSGANKLLLNGSVYIFTLVDGAWREVAETAVPVPPSPAVEYVLAQLGPVHTQNNAVFEQEVYPNRLLHSSPIDTTNFNQYRMHWQVLLGAASGFFELSVQYATTYGGTYITLGSVFGVDHLVNVNSLGSYATLPAGAKGASIYFRVMVAGNATHTISLSKASLQFKV